MKRKLLFLSAAIAAITFGASADVTYELLPNKNPGKGVAMKYNEATGAFECEVGELSSGTIKITTCDTDPIIEKYKTDCKLSSAGIWHTQIGTPYTGGVMDITEDGEPMTVTNMYTQMLSSGHTPEYIAFAGGVATVKNAKVSFWPDDMKLKITGTPDTYRDFAIAAMPESLTESNKNQAKTLSMLTHEGEGIYTGTHDFGQEDGEKEFIVASTSNNNRPVYGIAKETRADSSDETKLNLVAYPTIIADQRPVGNGAAKASKVSLVTPIKTTLKGQHKVTFNANTGELTLAADPGVQSAVVEISAADNAEVEYYNMQGVRVANPENGIYVRRQGNKVSKVIVK